jgi:hypothetical protein
MRRDGLQTTLTPTLDAGAYASGDVLFVPVQMNKITLETKGLATLRTLIVQDMANQKQDIDLLFFSADPGDIGAANAALDMSDAEFVDFIGHVRIATTDYVSGSANAYATKQLELLMQAKQAKQDLWVAGVCRSGTPTYGASGLTFKLLWERL